MSKQKANTNADKNEKPVTFETQETTLAKRILNSNLNDEDKIDLIQLIGKSSNIISIPSVWTTDPKQLAPFYRGHETDEPRTPELIITCSAD